MRDIARAQRLLSLFTSPERAEGIAGDLSEERRDRCATWFWLQVLRTTVTLWRSALMSAPLATLALAVAGAACLAAPGLGGIAAVALFPQLTGSLASWIVLSMFWWGGALCTGVSLVGIVPARGMTACVLLAVSGEALLAAFWLTGIPAEALSGRFVVPVYTTAMLTAVPLLAGGAIARSRLPAAGRPTLEAQR